MKAYKMSEEELNNMDKKLLVRLVLSLQESVELLNENTNLLLEQIRLMNSRKSDCIWLVFLYEYKENERFDFVSLLFCKPLFFFLLFGEHLWLVNILWLIGFSFVPLPLSLFPHTGQNTGSLLFWVLRGWWYFVPDYDC